MNRPYQPPGPQQASSQSMPPPDFPPNHQRSTPSRPQLPAPHQLLQYADSYHQPPSPSQIHHQHPSMNLPPPRQSMATPPPQPQLQQHLQQQHQPSALTTSHPARRETYSNGTGYTSANTSSKDAEPPQAILASVSHVDEVVGHKYQLDVIQQPKRARMCGFGDKDRRPITPPPCVRLTIIDIATGKEINYNEIDHAMFVLNVDLWNADGTREVNLVRSSAASSSTVSSSANLHGFTSYGAIEPTQDAHAMLPGPDASYRHQRAASYSSEYPPQATYSDENNTCRPGGTYPASSQHHFQHQACRPEQSMEPHGNGGHSRLVSTPDGCQDPVNVTRTSASGGQPQGMFTRNLIGSVAVSAFNLCDTEGKRGIWFVLQDLSVRTEGNFRLRFSFVNVGSRGGRAPPDGAPAKVTTGRAPILASSCSEVFSVFSAKKFPGVCESTALSKTFALQGIKIPIRKEAGGKGDDEDGYGD